MFGHLFGTGFRTSQQEIPCFSRINRGFSADRRGEGTGVRRVADRRGGYKLLSTVTARGELQSAAVEKSVDGPQFIAFLERLIRDPRAR